MQKAGTHAKFILSRRNQTIKGAISVEPNQIAQIMTINCFKQVSKDTEESRPAFSDWLTRTGGDQIPLCHIRCVHAMWQLP